MAIEEYGECIMKCSSKLRKIDLDLRDAAYWCDLEGVKKTLLAGANPKAVDWFNRNAIDYLMIGNRNANFKEIFQILYKRCLDTKTTA